LGCEHLASRVFLGSLAYIGASMNQSLAAGGVLEPVAFTLGIFVFTV
jgi:hypothetical protein